MASNTFSKKSDLAAQVLRIINRTGVQYMVDETDNIIRFAEAKLNRKLSPVETDTALTGIVGNRRIDISAISLVRPVALFIKADGVNEVPMLAQLDGSMPYSGTNGEPSAWATDGTGSYIDFDCPLDKAYAFRFRNVQRFKLVGDNDTNWLLTNHPDVYLAACIVWGYARMEDLPSAGQWQSQLQDGLIEVAREINLLSPAVMFADPAIQMLGRRGDGFNILTGN